jgi:hypothetical protein
MYSNHYSWQILMELDFFSVNFRKILKTYGGPGSSVGIEAGYGLDGPGIESRWGRDFSHTSRPDLGPTQPPVQWAPGMKILQVGSLVVPCGQTDRKCKRNSNFS